jgi:subtilisin family serine protease
MTFLPPRSRGMGRARLRAAGTGLFVEQLEARNLLSASAVPAVSLPAPDAHIAVLPSLNPTDPQFSSQWDFQNSGQNGGTAGADIHATQAWAVTTGSTHTTIAVIDTGIDYDHPDLYKNVWINQAEIPLSRRVNLVDVDRDGLITFYDLNSAINQGVGKILDVNRDGRIDAADILAPMVKDGLGRDTGTGGWADGVSEDGDRPHTDDLVGWNFVANTNNPFDDNGHGTHVSGTIGAQGDSGVGVAGIDWRCQIMAVKFLDNTGNGYLSNATQAIEYAVAHGARVLNNSWGGGGYDQGVANAIQDAQNHGDIFVVAAGNNSQSLDVTPNYPASYGLANVVTVAATDRNDQLASFSNFGSNVTIAAPGASILSTTPNNTYSWYSGTSMAAPHVTGVIGLILSEHPDWNYQQVISQLVNSTDPLASLQGRVHNAGRLDAGAAVGNASATDPRLAAYVQSLYGDVLHRTAGNIDLFVWVRAMQLGLSRAQVAQSIWDSTEHRALQVEGFYQRFLHRSADAAGEAYWTGRLVAGLSEEQLVRSFVTSREYQSQHATAAAFVQGLYADLLGRGASSADVAAWLPVLATGNRDGVAAGVFRSGECINAMIVSDYAAFLKRGVDAGGLGAWAGLMLAQPGSDDGVALGLLASNEYFARS